MPSSFGAEVIAVRGAIESTVQCTVGGCASATPPAEAVSTKVCGPCASPA